MRINNQSFHTIWLSDDKTKIQIIDQRYLPFQFIIEELNTVNDVYRAIKDMHLRGAPLIGVAAAYGMYLSAIEAINTINPTEKIKEDAARLISSRPTAVNLSYAVQLSLEAINKSSAPIEKIAAALDIADSLKQKEINNCRQIGENGLPLIEKIAANKNGKPVNILTHCNAGWLACVDYGTATAPIYLAKKKELNIHVWVDETRPRNQGARLTAYELGEEGVPHTIIADNTGGHLMQNGMVDIVIVGCDRMALNGDCANKIGTYLKALAAKDNNLPFYVALPYSTIDFSIPDGSHIPVETRSAEEVKYAEGWLDDRITSILITPQNSTAANYGFDITPGRLITGIITEKGILRPGEKIR